MNILKGLQWRGLLADCASWYVVPADHKWFTRTVVAEVIVDTLESLDLSYPRISSPKRKQLASVRTALKINKAQEARPGFFYVRRNGKWQIANGRMSEKQCQPAREGKE